MKDESLHVYALKYDGIITHSLIIVDSNQIALYKGKIPKFVIPLFVGDRCIFTKDFFILLKDQGVIYTTPLPSIYPLICRDIVIHTFVNRLLKPVTVDEYKRNRLVRLSQFICYFPSLDMAEECFPFRGQRAMQLGYTIVDKDCLALGESKDIYYPGYDVLSLCLYVELNKQEEAVEVIQSSLKKAKRQSSQQSISLSDLSGPITHDG